MVKVEVVLNLYCLRAVVINLYNNICLLVIYVFVILLAISLMRQEVVFVDVLRANVGGSLQVYRVCYMLDYR